MLHLLGNVTCESEVNVPRAVRLVSRILLTDIHAADKTDIIIHYQDLAVVTQINVDVKRD